MIRTSTVIGAALMDLIDAGAHTSIMMHGVPTDERERLLTQLCVEHGFTRRDDPENADVRGAERLGTGVTIYLWP